MNSCEAISQRHEETYSTMHNNMCYAPFCVANHTRTCISLLKKEKKKAINEQHENYAHGYLQGVRGAVTIFIILT